MNILQQFKRIFSLYIIQALLILPAFSLDLESTVIDNNRSSYEKQTKNTSSDSVITKDTKEKTTNPDNIEKSILPTVPVLPKNANSPTVAPINTQYSGRMPNEEALFPYKVEVKELMIDESMIKSRTAEKRTDKNTILVKNETKKTDKVSKNTSNTNKLNYRTCTLAKGTQIRAINKVKITDSLQKGQTIDFFTTQELTTPYFKIPKNTKLTAKIIDSHKPQISCNGSLVALRIISANINGYNQTLNAGIIKIKTDNIHFSNLKGEHTYLKTVCKKSKWGQNIFNKWSKTSSKLANKGAAVILAPFPYIGGCILAASSTISSPITALLGKGGAISIPANTVFTIKLYDAAKLRY